MNKGSRVEKALAAYHEDWQERAEKALSQGFRSIATAELYESEVNRDGCTGSKDWGLIMQLREEGRDED